MPGTLFVVATPIGNLEDITIRAIRVLREADLIAAEDTRRTGRLLAAYGIANRTVSFHAHNTRSRLPQLLARLTAGESVALVTDAGTPGISDPGVELVRACVNQGIAIDPIPGPSAPIAAAVASGFSLEPLIIYGFPPSRSKARIEWFRSAAAHSGTVSFFEAPHRIFQTLRDIPQYFGTRPIVVARELTKLHQEFLRGTAEQLLLQLHEPVKGEITILIGPMANNVAATTEIADHEIVALFCRLSKIGDLSRRAAISQVAGTFGISPRTVYATVERAKNR